MDTNTNSALASIDVTPLSPAHSPNIIRSIISSLFWSWYRDNENKVAFRLHIALGITKTFLLKDLKEPFELIFGPEPT